MTLPHDKRFPIEFELVASPAAETRLSSRAQSSDEPTAAIARVAERYDWPVTGDGERWVVDAREGRRVLAESVDSPRGPLIRFRRPLAAGRLTPPREIELLRQNARTAHTGFAVGSDGRAQLVSALFEDSIQDEEVDAVLRSMIAGGEAVGARPLTAFDPTSYNTSSEPGRWEIELLADSLGRKGIDYQLTGARAIANLRVDGGRRQTVHLLFDRADAWGDQVVQLISICAPATPDWHHRALSANATFPLATLALATFGAQENLVTTRTLLARTTDADQLLSFVTILAQAADRVEFELTGGKDVN